MADKTIFRKIIDRELPATIRYEDDLFLAFDDIHPSAPIHVLIISKEPYESLEAVSIDDAQFHAQLLQVIRRLARELGIADNYQIHCNVGKMMQQVQHFHCHLLGGFGKLDAESGSVVHSVD